MAALKNRVRHSDGVDTVPFQARVKKLNRDAVRRAAERSGMSHSLYLDSLFEQLMSTDGQLPVLASPRPQKEMLPIGDVA